MARMMVLKWDVDLLCVWVLCFLPYAITLTLECCLQIFTAIREGLHSDSNDLGKVSRASPPSETVNSMALIYCCYIMLSVANTTWISEQAGGKSSELTEPLSVSLLEVV